jgi:hypothetical protein
MEPCGCGDPDCPSCGARQGYGKPETKEDVIDDAMDYLLTAREKIQDVIRIVESADIEVFENVKLFAETNEEWNKTRKELAGIVAGLYRAERGIKAFYKNREMKEGIIRF